MNPEEELRKLREEIEELQHLAERLESDDTTGSAFLVGQTTTLASYPAAVQAWFYMKLMAITGTETEGGAATIAEVPGKEFFAYNIGNQQPAPGTTIGCHQVGGSYVFSYNG